MFYKIGNQLRVGGDSNEKDERHEQPKQTAEQMKAAWV